MRTPRATKAGATADTTRAATAPVLAACLIHRADDAAGQPGQLCSHHHDLESQQRSE